MITKDIKNNMEGVYIIRNLINGKIYIGSSKNIKNRLKTHLNMLKKNIHHSIDLQVDFNKYGEDNFESEILIECSSADARKYEEDYIDKLGLKKFGYNSAKNKRTTQLRYGLFVEQLYNIFVKLGYKADGRVYWFDIFKISKIMNLPPTKILKNFGIDRGDSWVGGIDFGNNEYATLNYDNDRGVQITAFHNSCFDLSWEEQEDVYIY